MKKLILIPILTLCLSATAQIKGFVGVKGGGQLSTAYIEHTIYNIFMDVVPIPGYHAGVTAKIFTNKREKGVNAGLQLGATYIQKGWKQRFPTENDTTYTNKMYYLEMPAEAIIYIGKGDIKLFVTIGMYLEYLLRVDQDDEPSQETIGQADFYTYDIDRDNRLGYGGRASVGMWYDSPFGTFQLEGFFTFSISNMFDYEDFDTRIPDLANHYAFGASVSYMIPFGKMDF